MHTTSPGCLCTCAAGCMGKYGTGDSRGQCGPQQSRDIDESGIRINTLYILTLHLIRVRAKPMYKETVTMAALTPPAFHCRLPDYNSHSDTWTWPGATPLAADVELWASIGAGEHQTCTEGSREEIQIQPRGPGPSEPCEASVQAKFRNHQYPQLTHRSRTAAGMFTSSLAGCH